MAGRARPSAAQKGRPIDLDGAIRAKMERAFGDLSAVKFYESQAVGQAGAEAMAQGSEIAFAPGMTDFTSRAGQERLGHELSHVMSQRSGRVRGQGFLASSALEARADREGAMAAAGEQVYTGPVTHALSDTSPSPASAAPMQAKRNGGGEDPDRGKPDRAVLPGTAVEEGALGYDDLDPDLWEERAHERGLFSRMIGRKRKFYKARIDRRPWEMTREELDANPSNPNNVAELNTVQNEIATAGSTTSGRNPVKKNGVMNRKAWKAFQNYGKSKHTQTYLLTGKEWKMEDVDHGAFTAKLKNMSRMVRDYPELQGKVGHMLKMDKELHKQLLAEKKAKAKKPGARAGAAPMRISSPGSVPHGKSRREQRRTRKRKRKRTSRKVTFPS